MKYFIYFIGSYFYPVGIGSQWGDALRLTVIVLANLWLTVNTFSLFPPDIFFTVNFFSTNSKNLPVFTPDG